MKSAGLYPYKVKAKVRILSEVAGYQIPMLNIPAMWKDTQGEGVTVAVLDTGVPAHKDIDVYDKATFVPDYLYDKNGHSTHCCGIVAAKVNNGIGVQGIAPKVKLIPVAVLNEKGSGDIQAIVNGINWCIDNHVDVINMSLGIQPVVVLRELHDIIKKATDNGITIICAAGNESGPVDLPAAYTETIAVAAIDKKKKRAYFSNIGRAVDFCTPGVDIFSTYLNNSYALLSGTSMASPVLTGVAALIISKHRKHGKELTPQEVKEHIARITIDLGIPGDDPLYGDGLPVFNAKSLPRIPWYKKLFSWLF